MTDGDTGDTHTVRATSDDRSVATVSVSGKRLTVRGVACGTATMRVTARDNSGASNATSAAVTFTATVPNSRPVVGSISDLTVSRGSTGTRTVSVTDGDSGDTPAVSARSSDTGVATVSVSGNRLTVRGVSRGTATITATATDECGASGSAEFDVTVPNTRPVVGSISDLTVSRGSTGTRTVTVTDGDADDTHEVSASSSDEGVATVSVNGKTLTVSGGARGRATIEVTARDDSGESNDTSAAVRFGVRVPNSRPVVSPIPDKRVSRASGGSVTVTVTDADPGDAHTVSARSGDEAVATVDVTGKTLTLESVSSGEATITVTARDDSGESNATSAAVPFEAMVNSPPEVDLIADLTVPPGTSETLAAPVTDANSGDAHTVSAESDDAAVASVEVSGRELMIAGKASGHTMIGVTANDGLDSSAKRTFGVIVNTRPEVDSIADLTVSPGAAGTLTVPVTDADAGDAHQVAASSDDTGVATVSVSGEELTLAGVSAGEATITVTAIDDSGGSNAASAPATFAAIVNTLPEVDAIAPQLVETGADLAVAATATDPDAGQAHRFAAESDDTGVATVSVSGAELTLTGVSAGEVTITVTATDDSGGSNAESASATFAVTVNARPEVDPIESRLVETDAELAVEVSVTDADASQTQTLTAESDDPGVVTVEVSEDGTELTLVGVSAGEATITVTATDDSGAPNATSEALAFAVTVNDRSELSAISDQTLAPGATATLAVAIADADAGQAHSLAAESDDPAVATVSVSGEELTLTGVSAGAATITVTATDDSQAPNAESEPATFAVIVNSPPEVDPIAPQLVETGEDLAVTTTATDPDGGQEHTLAAESSDAAVATVSVSGMELTLTGVTAGAATITVTAMDDSGGSNAKSSATTFAVTVNARPEVGPIAELTVSPGSAEAATVSVTDADSRQTHDLIAESDDPAVATADVSGTELTVTGVASGSASIEVTATDDSEAPNAKSEPATLAVTVNTRPELEPIAGLTIAPSSTETVAATVVDPDAGQTHALAAKTSDAAVATVDVSGTELTLTGVLAGAATITVTATDHSGGSNAESAPATFTAIVNTRPVVEPIGALSIAMDAGTATVSVVVTDPDAGQTPALTAESNAPAVATVEVSEDGTELTLTGVSAGGAMITVTATDDSGGSNAKSEAIIFEVAVSNSRPVVEEPVSDQTLSPGESLTLAVTVTDADAGDLHAVAASSSDDAVATAEVSEDGTELTLTGVSAGEASIEVTATDDSEAPNAKSEPATLAVTVNTRPELEPIAGLTIAPSSTETVAATVVDPDAGQTHALAAKTSDAAVATVDMSGTELTLTGVLAGAATITVTATDHSGGSNAESAPATFTAIVNTRPVVEPIGALSIAMDAGTATVSVVVTDPDAGQTPALTAESNAPAVATVEVSEDGTELTLTGVSAGGAMISVTATDDSGGSNAKSEAVAFEVAVSNSRPVVEEPVSDRTLSPGESLTLAVTVTDVDADDAHAVAASSSDEAVAAAEVSEDGTELTLTGVSAGEAMIEVIATDDSDADNAESEPATFAARVNTRPAVEPIEAQSIEPAGEPVVVAVAVTDPDSGQEHDVVAESDAAAVAVEVSEDGTELTLTGVSAGEATITVTATDDSEADNAISEPVEFAVVSNTAPTAEDDMALTGEYTAVEIDVLANDTDPDGQPLRVESATNGVHGTATVTGGAVTYTPDLGFRGIDIFGYTVTDGVDTAEASVWVWVDVLRASPNPSYTGSYTLYWVEPPRGDVATEVWETTGGASERVFFGLGTSKSFSRRPEGTYTYHLGICDADGECLAMPEPHLDVEVMFSPVSEIAAANTTGNMPYETGVTKGGDAYIHMPLVPVPGVNGLQPRLSFDYSGGRDRQRLDKNLPGDILGYGWHVGGFSAIRWCLTNQSRTEIAFTRADNLCLDGEPLVLAAGTHLNYGAEYRTLRDTYAKIVLRRSDEPGVGWFEVRMADGSVREYGRTPDSNLVHADASGSRTFLWSVNKETDAFDNEMTYEYHEDEAALARHPKRIAYGDGGDAEILFEYAGRGDIATVMAGGLEQVQWLRVHSVDVRLNSSTVRKYLLESEVTTEGWVRLTKLQMCAYRADAMGMMGAQECLPPFVLEWMDIAESDAVPIEKTCVSKLTDPLGVDTKFTYATLTEKGSYDFLIDADDAPFGDVIAPANVRALPATVSDDMETGGRIKPIVTQVARTNGVGGEHVMKYAYLVEDGEDKPRGFESTLNWGFLGFYAIRETDAESGIVTYTQYRLDYPHFGKPARVSQYDGEYGASPETLWERYVTYENNRIRHASRNRTDLPQVRFETELIHEGGTQLGATHTKYALELTSDGYPETLERTTKAGHSVTPRDPPPNRDSFWGNSRTFTVDGLQRRTITETVFHNRTGTHWLIGFADYVTVRQGTGSAERTIKTDLTHEGNTNAVDTATRFPGDANLGFETDYRYDSYGNREQAVVTARHASMRVSSIDSFAAARYPTSITNAAEHVEQLEHDARLGLPTKATDANNRVARLKYDALGREVERVREWDKSATTTTSYDSCTMCDVTVAAGKCSFDESRTVKPAMVSETISPMTPTMQGAMSREAPTTRRYFDKLGRPIRTEVEAFEGDNPRRVDAFYDARGRLACESAPYHSDETPHYTKYAYDVRDRVTAVTRPDGGSTAIVYGAVAAAHRVKATATQTVKEADGTVADTRASERLYNLLGELVKATDGSDQTSANKVTTTYGYDTSGLLETVTADGVEMSFKYDAAGNRESVTNPDMGTAADGKSVKFAYTGLGQVRERTDGRGTTSYRYDLLGRPTSRVDPAGMGTVTATWSYDPTNGKGRLASRGYGGTAFSETYEYNDQARLEETTTTIRDGSTTETLVASHGYDRLGRPSTTTYPSELKVERGYNARGYLSTLADATTATKKTLVRYGAMDARGNIETETFGNGAQTTRAHDPKTGRARAIVTSRGTSTFQNHAYAWLTDGSLASRTANAAGGGATARTLRKEEFDYDYLGRLDSAATKLGGATTASRTLDYGYDNRGNLTSKTSDAAGDKSVTSTMYEQGSAGPHALTRATVGDVVHDLHYDAQGHLERDDAASGDDRFIEWDGRGLATKVTVGTAKDAEKPAARETFLYGPGGARYLKTSEWKVVAADGTAVLKSETTYYVGAFEKTTRACTVGEGESETESTESVERTRVGPVLHVKRTPCGNSTAAPAEIEYRHFDHLGSSASITDAAGAELVALAHDPHGERRKPDWTRRLSESEIETLAADHGDRTSRGFTGHEHLDRTGLVHMNGRLYDPLLGRFLSPDPIVANPADGQQWNLYSYAGNSPLSYVDPSGLSFCDPAQQSWCGGVGLPSGGWGGGGYSTRTVSGWSAYVTFGVYYEIVRIWQSASVSRWDAGVEGGGSWGSTGDTFWEDVQRSVIYPIVQFFFWSFQVVEQGAANEPASSHSMTNGTGPLNRHQIFRRITFESSVDDAGRHDYLIRGLICRASSIGCNADLADTVFDHVNRNDIPLIDDDLGDGDRKLPFDNPIYHDENEAGRTTVNYTRKGHLLDEGQMEQRVYFDENGNLYYQVHGTGSGKYGGANNVLGYLLFRPGVHRVVRTYGR